MKVLDRGFVDLVDSMGGDLRVVNAAKVSFNKQSEELGNSERKLISYLMKHRHGSPFEHSYFTFHVKAPIFVVREWQRHRIGSFNEMSGRYVEFEPEFYTPSVFREAAETNKQGSRVPFNNERDTPEWHQQNAMRVLAIEAASYDYYKTLLEQGVAREIARMILPLSLYTEFYWTVNARSLMNFLNLRLGEDAQWEIRQYAQAVEQFFIGKMGLTHMAWVENGRIAP